MQKQQARFFICDDCGEKVRDHQLNRITHVDRFCTGPHSARFLLQLMKVLAQMEREQHYDELCEEARSILTRVNEGDDKVDWRLLKKAIKTLWVDRRVFDDSGKSPLTLVCEMGFKEGVELLLLLGANVTELDEVNSSFFVNCAADDVTFNSAPFLH